jgi:hypothetical protein
MKRSSRKASKLSESLRRHLNAYALAASAAGVGMLALTQHAEAKIVAVEKLLSPKFAKITSRQAALQTTF